MRHYVKTYENAEIKRHGLFLLSSKLASMGETAQKKITPESIQKGSVKYVIQEERRQRWANATFAFPLYSYNLWSVVMLCFFCCYKDSFVKACLLTCCLFSYQSTWQRRTALVKILKKVPK